MVLADLGPADPLIVFVEVVATDGAMTSRRQQAMQELTDGAGFKRSQVAFVTAFRDRESIGFRKTAALLAWSSFACFASEPAKIVILQDGAIHLARLAHLLDAASAGAASGCGRPAGETPGRGGPWPAARGGPGTSQRRGRIGRWGPRAARSPRPEPPAPATRRRPPARWVPTGVAAR